MDKYAHKELSANTLPVQIFSSSLHENCMQENYHQYRTKSKAWLFGEHTGVSS